jgi:ubiquinone/menaquinone biosynthesis C-methylase UbiE
MSKSPEEVRQAALKRIAATYGQYEATGYAQRWRTMHEGDRLALKERDQWVVGTLAPALPGTVVDLGAGTGNLAVALDSLQRRPAHFIGIDLLEERLEEARRRAPWAEWRRASVDQTSLPPGSAHAVVAMTLFSSLLEPWLRQAVAREIERITHPAGRVILYDLRLPSPGNRHVRPFGTREIKSLFPGWDATIQTMTLLPPLARSPLGGGRARYRLLAAIPPLRSHVGAVLVRAG